MTVPDFALTEWVDWTGMPHRQLHAAATIGNQPGKVYAAGLEWELLGADLIAAAHELVERVRATAPGWHAAILDMARWCAGASSTAYDIGALVAELGRAAEVAMIKMPEPVDLDWAGTLDRFAEGSDPLALVDDVWAASEQVSLAHECAVDVLCELENRSREIDCCIPECPPWPPPVATGAAVARDLPVQPGPWFDPTPTGPIERVTPAGAAGLTGEDILEPPGPVPAVVCDTGARWR